MTGFDGGMQGWLVDETLTTIRIPASRVAELLVTRLMAQLDGGPPAEHGMVLPTELVIGTSASTVPPYESTASQVKSPVWGTSVVSSHRPTPTPPAPRRA